MYEQMSTHFAAVAGGNKESRINWPIELGYVRNVTSVRNDKMIPSEIR